MKELTNEAVLEMVNNGMISVDRLHHLVYLKEFIDRIGTKKYLEEKDVVKIELSYGVKPNVVTWGDYFQTELASSLRTLSDEEFIKAIETVRFDMMSSYMIFNDKNDEIFNWIASERDRIELEKKQQLTEADEEIVHLNILKDYYLNIGIVDKFTEQEMQWYTQFNEAAVI